MAKFGLKSKIRRSGIKSESQSEHFHKQTFSSGDKDFETKEESTSDLVGEIKRRREKEEEEEAKKRRNKLNLRLKRGFVVETRA